MAEGSFAKEVLRTGIVGEDYGGGSSIIQERMHGDPAPTPAAVA